MKSSLTHGAIVAVVGFVAAYGATLVHFIPQNILDLTVGSIISSVIATISYYNSQLTIKGKGVMWLSTDRYMVYTI